MVSNKFKIITADWDEHRSVLRHIRKTVFIDEQSVPEELEWDESDHSCTHFLVSMDDKYIATARIKQDGQIGRMAVLKEHRRSGVGSALLDHIIGSAIRAGHEKVFLHSQVDVVEFYRRRGFRPSGEIFIDANIPHQAMSKNLRC